MMNTLTCPKCLGRKLWYIERFSARESGTVNGRNELRPVAGVKTPPEHVQERGEWHSAGRVDLIICAKCGFAELWCRELDRLIANPDYGVQFLDNEESAGPYR